MYVFQGIYRDQIVLRKGLARWVSRLGRDPECDYVTAMLSSYIVQFLWFKYPPVCGLSQAKLLTRVSGQNPHASSPGSQGSTPIRWRALRVLCVHCCSP